MGIWHIVSQLIGFKYLPEATDYVRYWDNDKSRGNNDNDDGLGDGESWEIRKVLSG